MTRDGSWPTGAGGEEPGGPEDDEASGLAEGEPDDAVVRGWVPPEDRLWRHPSELAGQLAGWRAVAHHAAQWERRPAGGVRSARRRMAMSLVATGAVAAVAAGVVLMNAAVVNRNEGMAVGQATSTTTAFTSNGSSASASGAMPAAAAAVTHAMVALTFTTPSGSRSACALAVAEGGLVATAADALASATSVTVVLPGGRSGRAVPVAVDRESDIALLRVPFDLPVPRFDSTIDDSGGGSAMVLSTTAQAGTGASPTWKWGLGTIRGQGAPVGHGQAGLMGITAETSAPAVPGGVLVEPDGAVAGLLDHATTSATGQPVQVFVPAWLLLGVSGELASWGSVRHGWLDVTATDLPGGAQGALVQSVQPDGASSQVLESGDVIVGVGAFKVRSMAELRERLYLLAPGSPVRLQVQRGAVTTTMIVNLAATSYTAASQP